MKGVIIREITPDDLADIYRLGLEKFGPPPFNCGWVPEKIADALVSSMQYSVAVLRRKKILGFAITEIEKTEKENEKHACLRWVCVTKTLRDRLEEPMLKTLFEKTTAGKIKLWSAPVRKDDTILYNLLKNRGFSDNGEIMFLKLDN